MATNVYANDNEICSKTAKGKSTASFPDPCWSPPPPPAGPIVLPYPNTARAKTLKKGTKTVLIKNTMVAKKDISFFAKSSGNEPATKAFQKGVLTRKIQGKAYFITWSQNVKFEGKGVARHNDKMTHNHGSMMGNTPPNGYRDTTSSVKDACKEQFSKINDECEQSKDPKEKDNAWMKTACEKLQVKPDHPATQETLDKWVKQDERKKIHSDNELIKKLTNYNQKFINDVSRDVMDSVVEQPKLANKTTLIMSDLASQNSCITVRRCKLTDYENTTDSSKIEQGKGCCPGQTGHHVIPEAVGKHCSGYNHDKAPTICAEGVSNSHGSHGELHKDLANAVKEYKEFSSEISYPDMRDMCVESALNVFPNSGCTKECFNAQLDGFYLEICGNKTLEPKSGVGGRPKNPTKTKIVNKPRRSKRTGGE